MQFNPVATANDFASRRFPDALQYDREQKHAHEHCAFAPDIRAELDKLLRCDLLVLQFPLWWFSVPAIMKGWIDRVLVNGIVYGKGKRAMLATTTACSIRRWWRLTASLPPSTSTCGTSSTAPWRTRASRCCDLRDMVYPLHRRHAAPGYLEQYAQRMGAIEQEEPMPRHTLDEFGADWRLKPGIEPRTAAHRRPAGTK